MYTEITTGDEHIILDKVNVFPRTIPHIPDRHLPFLWYGITKKWAGTVNHRVVSGMMPRPLNDETIYLTYRGTHDHIYFERCEQNWTIPAIDVESAIAIYSFADGSYAAWNTHTKKITALSFSENIHSSDNVIRTSYWTLDGKDPRFDQFLDILKTLIQPLEVEYSRLVRASLWDCRDMLGFLVQGNEVPLIHLSFPVLRAVILAWAIVHELSEWDFANQLLKGRENPERLFLFVEEPPAFISPKNIQQLQNTQRLQKIPIQSFISGNVE